MSFLDVQKMGEYWLLEPPLASLYFSVHFQRKSKAKGQQTMNLIPNTGASKPWDKQPEHIKKAIIGHYLAANPGKSEADFEKDRIAQQRARYASRLEEARKTKRTNN